VSLETVEHVAEPAVVLANFKAHLAPGGNLLVSLPVFPTLAINRFHKFQVRSASEAAGYFESCGFDVVSGEVQARKYGLFELRPRETGDADGSQS
jgi:2-polyprenyl-3-methyl-5-hydroxy-6-metoxy-1,4-benzoquinol methylase